MLCVFCNSEFIPRYPIWVLLLGHEYKLVNMNRPTHPTCFIQVCEPFVGIASKEMTLHPYQIWSIILVTSFCSNVSNLCWLYQEKRICSSMQNLGENLGLK